jgi:hypothetical protein
MPWRVAETAAQSNAARARFPLTGVPPQAQYAALRHSVSCSRNALAASQDQSYLQSWLRIETHPVHDPAIRL